MSLARSITVHILARNVAVAVIPLLLLGASPPAAGMIFLSTADPNHNTAAPVGDLANSGWDLQGRWNGFLGTPVAPNLFLTAKHVGGSVGDVFQFQGVNYTTVQSYGDPESDLRLWRICGGFPMFATLYTKSNELGKPLVLFGRGLTRGSEIVVDGFPQAEAKGWRWGGSRGVMRWGENLVSQALDGSGLPDLDTTGELLASEFNQNGGDNEAHLASGDSGGAVFIQDGDQWKLAGINYAVDGPFNTDDDPEDSGFNAALYDKGGLYEKSGDAWVLVADTPINAPSRFYATRVSARQGWINGIIDTWSAVQPPPILTAAGALNGPFEPVDNATPEDGAYEIPLAEETRFYRLDGCVPSRILDIAVTGDSLVIQFEAVE